MIDRRAMHFKVNGRLVYGPKRGKDKNGKDVIDKDRVAIQVPCFDICDYYAYQFKKKFGIELIRPSWEPHITVIPQRKYLKNKSVPWGYRNGETVSVEYSHFMFWNQEHVWVAAACEAVDDLRVKYGHQSYDRGHFTIGKFHPDDVGKLPDFKKFEDEVLWKDYIWNTPFI